VQARSRSGCRDPRRLGRRRGAGAASAVVGPDAARTRALPSRNRRGLRRLPRHARPGRPRRARDGAGRRPRLRRARLPRGGAQHHPGPGHRHRPLDRRADRRVHPRRAAAGRLPHRPADAGRVLPRCLGPRPRRDGGPSPHGAAGAPRGEGALGLPVRARPARAAGRRRPRPAGGRPRRARGLPGGQRRPLHGLPLRPTRGRAARPRGPRRDRPRPRRPVGRGGRAQHQLAPRVRHRPVDRRAGPARRHAGRLRRRPATGAAHGRPGSDLGSDDGARPARHPGLSPLAAAAGAL
ncbi:MAG: Putative diheme cytochrome c-553, partial [uncultured Acetobacteraceae bacterium]